MVLDFNEIIFVLFYSFIDWCATLHHLQGQLLDIVVLFFSLLHRVLVIFLVVNLLGINLILKSLNQRRFILIIGMIIVFQFFLITLIILFIVIIFVTATVFHISIFIAWNHVCRFHLGDRNDVFALWRIFKDDYILNLVLPMIVILNLDHVIIASHRIISVIKTFASVHRKLFNHKVICLNVILRYSCARKVTYILQTL